MSAQLGQGLPGPGRLEAFSDGVLAIMITLLVLELKPPHLPGPNDAGEALAALLALAPKFLGYLLSFLFIAVFWVNHHRFFRLVQRVDSGLQRTTARQPRRQIGKTSLFRQRASDESDARYEKTC